MSLSGCKYGGLLSSKFVFSRAKQWTVITGIVSSRHPFGLLFFHPSACKPQHEGVINSLLGRNTVLLCFILFRHEIVMSGERDGWKELRILVIMPNDFGFRGNYCHVLADSFVDEIYMNQELDRLGDISLKCC